MGCDERRTIASLLTFRYLYNKMVFRFLLRIIVTHIFTLACDQDLLMGWLLSNHFGTLLRTLAIVKFAGARGDSYLRSKICIEDHSGVRETKSFGTESIL